MTKDIKKIHQILKFNLNKKYTSFDALLKLFVKTVLYLEALKKSKLQKYFILWPTYTKLYSTTTNKPHNSVRH